MKPEQKSEGQSAQGHASPPGSRRGSAAFLLAQVGAHAASKFSQRLAPLKLSPPHAGILRILGAAPSITQQALAGALRMPPSRLVAFLDELEARELIERRADPHDRRRHALHLTEKGHSVLEAIARVAREHQKELLNALKGEEQNQLADLLQRIADQQGLKRGVHPGYAHLGEQSKRNASSQLNRSQPANYKPSLSAEK